MQTITIRRGTTNDLPVLLEFEQGVVEAERPFDPTLKRSHIHYYDLSALLTSEDSVVIVAEAVGRIVGTGYARIEISKPHLQHDRHAYLGFMYVDPEHRRQGINGLIIEALKNWSLGKEISELRLDVYHDNTAAMKAYEKVGFQKLLVEMRMPISPDTHD
jgi:ribosomal protein S18 acetylase RimI-like enzyme